MPLIVVKMLEGRSIEQKRLLAREITDVVTKVTGAAEAQVDVVGEDAAVDVPFHTDGAVGPEGALPLGLRADNGLRRVFFLQ